MKSTGCASPRPRGLPADKAHQQQLKRFAKGAATLSVVPRVSHNTISQHPMYLLLLSGKP